MAYIPVILTSSIAFITLSKIIFGLELSINLLMISDIAALTCWGSYAYKTFKKYEKEELSLIDKYQEIYINKDWFVDDIEKTLESFKIYNVNCKYYEETKEQMLNSTKYNALELSKKT